MLSKSSTDVVTVMLVVLAWLAIGGLVGWAIAKNKGRGTAGFLLGAILGWIGWIVAACLRPFGEADLERAADRKASWFSKVWPPVVTFAGFLGVWYAYSALRFDIAARRINSLPFPHEVINKGFLPLWDPRNGLRPILPYMAVTLRVTLVGLAVSIVLGVSIAVLMNLSKSTERAIFPYAVVLQTVPILAILPLLTQLFGEEFGVRLVVVVLIAIFPIITNTLFGLQSADRLHHDLFTLNRTKRLTRLVKLELPGALPAMLTGIRIASGGAVIGAVVADFFFVKGEKGIGFYIRVKQQRAAERPEMFAGTIMASLFGIVMFLVIGFLTTRAIRNWHESAATRT